MALKGVDIAWSRPTTSAIKAVGAHFVARYLSPDSSKNITAAEVKDYKANGLGVVVVWEGSANRMLGGYAAGKADAQSAEVQRAAVGLPNDMPIYFACDFDVQGTQYHTINEYMRGVNDVIGLSRSGFYGGYYAVNNVASSPARATYFWQTIAWSGGHVSSHTNIYQSGGTTLSGGADWDTAETADYGQYPRPSAPTPEEDPLAGFTKQDIHDAVWSIDDVAAPADAPDYATNKTWEPQSFLKDLDARVRAIQVSEGAQSVAIAALAKLVGSGVDTPTVVAAVQKAIADAVAAGIKVDVNVKAGA